MKNLIILISAIIIVASCSTAKEVQPTSALTKNEKKILEQAIVTQAVETKRYIIKLERLYITHGGMVTLAPRSNYIIIDGKKAIISAGYLGRLYGTFPIAGINVRGISSEYEATSNIKKGIYDINMKVDNGKNSFNLYMTIGKNGNCNASVTNLYMDNVRYEGYLVPISDRNISVPLQNTEAI